MMLNLYPALKLIEKNIKDLEKQKERKLKEVANTYDTEIENYRRAYEVNLNLNEACSKCEGTGEEWESDSTSSGYESRSHVVKCKRCSGTGMKEMR